MTDPAEVQAAVAAAHRRDWAVVLAATVRTAGSLDLAEDCTQDAYVSALQTWPRDGIPRNPAAWLVTAARRNALDAHRRGSTLRRKLPYVIRENEIAPDIDEFGDDRLRLIFTCCHPALAREAQVALTLRLVCGLATPDIARSFLVSEPTMAARVTRAKKKIAGAGIPYRIPEQHELADRLDAVLTVLHLVFTAGHTAPSGPSLTNPELAERAIELTRVLVRLMPDEREALGLLALLLANQARHDGRTADGELVLLADQDRSGWDSDRIAEADRYVQKALRGARPGRFVLQAAIATLHAQAPSYADTDWPQIVGLYDLLSLSWPSPVVRLNRAVALALADGPQGGLAAMADLELPGYHYLPAARAELLTRLGRTADADRQYELALAQVDNQAERRFLLRKRAELH